MAANTASPLVNDIRDECRDQMMRAAEFSLQIFAYFKLHKRPNEKIETTYIQVSQNIESSYQLSRRTALLTSSTFLEPNSNRWIGVTMVVCLQETALVLIWKHINSDTKHFHRSILLSKHISENTNLFSKNKKWWWEISFEFSTVDRRFVNQCRFRFSC